MTRELTGVRISSTFCGPKCLFLITLTDPSAFSVSLFVCVFQGQVCHTFSCAHVCTCHGKVSPCMVETVPLAQSVPKSLPAAAHCRHRDHTWKWEVPLEGWEEEPEKQSDAC